MTVFVKTEKHGPHTEDNGNYEVLISSPSHVVRASPLVRLLSVLIAQSCRPRFSSAAALVSWLLLALADAAAALPPRLPSDGTSCAHSTHMVIPVLYEKFL